MATGRPAGRPAKPIAQKVAEGNLGKRKLPEQSLPAANRTVRVRKPDFGEHGNILWKQILGATEYLDKKIDVVLLALLCEAFQEYQVMRIALQNGTVDRTYTAPNGYIVSHPYVKEVQELRKQMTAWLAAFGFSPADRARLNIDLSVGAVSEMEAFTNRINARAAADNEE